METKTLITIIIFLFIHWIADFIFQTDKQAKGKSKNWEDLLGHTIIYTMTWWVSGAIYAMAIDNYERWDVTIFVFVTFVCHTITDYFTSRLNSRLWEQQRVHAFFVSIGFDQILHYIQLFGTYYLLTR